VHGESYRVRHGKGLTFIQRIREASAATTTVSGAPRSRFCARRETKTEAGAHPFAAGRE
jgi:hypothetical protein